MVAQASEALVVLGGAWHDFTAFAATVDAPLRASGLTPRVTFELGELAHLTDSRPAVVVLFTCLGDDSGPQHSPSELAALLQWVQEGGGLLALHSATVAAAHHPALATLLGAAFADHPPLAQLRVEPTATAHPTTAGVTAFSIEDELYLHRAAPEGDVHLVAVTAGEERPVAWSRREGSGKVYYFALGHDARSWSHPEYRRVFQQALAWLAP